MLAWLNSIVDITIANVFDVMQGLQVICKLQKAFYQKGTVCLSDQSWQKDDTDFDDSTMVNGLRVLYAKRQTDGGSNADSAKENYDNQNNG